MDFSAVGMQRGWHWQHSAFHFPFFFHWWRCILPPFFSLIVDCCILVAGHRLLNMVGFIEWKLGESFVSSFELVLANKFLVSAVVGGGLLGGSKLSDSSRSPHGAWRCCWYFCSLWFMWPLVRCYLWFSPFTSFLPELLYACVYP